MFVNGDGRPFNETSSLALARACHQGVCRQVIRFFPLERLRRIPVALLERFPTTLARAPAPHGPYLYPWRRWPSGRLLRCVHGERALWKTTRVVQSIPW